MTETPVPGQLTHGFLFADLRGYTIFAETYGDAAAADLLDRYRELVRGVLAELGGAEIKTEGDSFYVVFPSASRAVSAGLAIVARAAEPIAPSPTSVMRVDPIRVGVGVHAGEAEERAEGYVGTAVNIAARVCAQARPGEVLVTDTVRALTRTSGRYRFIARGRPALKGIAEPIALFAVEAATTAASGSGKVVSSRAVSAGAVALATVVVLGVVILSGALVADHGGAASGSAQRPGGSAAPASSSAPSGPLPFRTGRLAPGTYTTTAMEPTIRFTIPDGWLGLDERPNFALLEPFADDKEQLVFITPSVGYVPCSTTEYVTLPTRRDELVQRLASNRALAVHVAGTVTLGNAEAQQLDVALGDVCPGLTSPPLFLISKNTNTPDEAWYVAPGPAKPMFVVDAGGKAMVVLIDAPISKVETFTREVRSILSSLVIAP